MTFEISFVIAILLIAILLFITEKLPVDLVALMVMATLLVSRIISPEDGISGFSNTATVTIGAMFVISAGLFNTGALNVLGVKLERMGRRSFWLALITMMFMVGLISAFVNNTAAVVIFMPIVLSVAREAKVSPSKLLMPLSFASMFGGVCTLIGTSTNILVNSIAERHGLPSFGMFEFSLAGLAFFFVGMLYMVLIGVPMIPSSRADEDLTKQFEMNDYLTEIILLPKAVSIDKKIKDAPLVHDLDIDILEVFRGGKRLLLPTSDIILREYDVLRVRANVHKIQKIQEREGIAIKSGLQWRDKDLESTEAVLVEVVIAPHSQLEGKSLDAVKFRDRFGAAPLAIRRSGGIRHEKLGTTALRAGDALLIEARRDQLDNLKNHTELVFISEIKLPKFRKNKILPALAIVFGVVTSSALGLFPIVVSAIVGAILLILLGCLTLEEAYESIDWKVIFLLAGLLTLGIALEKSGAAVLISNIFVSGIGQWGPVTLLSAFYFVTTMLSNVMSNSASAALLAPIAIAAAESQGWNTRPFLMAVMFGASLSFMTPVGYHTNTLIYGPGQYKFSDFLRVGTPLNLLFWLLATWLIPMIWPF
ncbi:SLC13 family permease [Nitrospira defluvii]|nr:SLC13 family permease [Nitrospira defluvii]